jgi:glycosyltransferase involved in cell wall biosynthesis
MTHPAIVYDLTRLLLGPTLPVPRGIDRVDLGYASYFFESWPGECLAVLPLPLGLFGGAVVIKRDAARKLLARIARVWGETGSASDDPAYAFVRARLADPQADFAQPSAPNPFRPHRIFTNLFAAVFDMGGIRSLRLRAAIPRGAVYVNTGQLALAFGWLTRWLSHRPDIRRVHMLHDTIPLDHPDLVTRSGRDLHERMVACTARHAHGLIVTTEAVRRSVLRELARHSRPNIPTMTAPLPVPPLFLQEPAAGEAPPEIPYFVVLGSVEPRKNHALLLEVWRRWTEPEPPRLVIVGTPWRDTDKVLETVRTDACLCRSVIHVSGLTSPALRVLLRQACALLQPSFVEGFGLPVIEALALGTPVIASDQPSHREAGGAFATYLDPRDADGWERAVRAHLDGTARRKLASHRPWDWTQYGAMLGSFLKKTARHETAV